MDLSPHELQIPVNTGLAMLCAKAPSYLDMGKIRFHSFNLHAELNYEGFQSL